MIDEQDIEPSWRQVLDQRLRTRLHPPYRRATIEEMQEGLDRFLARHAAGRTAEDLRRLGGGGSKEQFIFDSDGERFVLRMDPQEGVVATSREREFEALTLLGPTVPVPEPVWLDAHAEFFPQPAMIVRFCNGVTRPPAAESAGNITGIGTVMGPAWRERLSGSFVQQLAEIHNVDWRSYPLRHLGVPDADPQQAARWQVNAWIRVWREDKLVSMPSVTLAHRWMLENLPATDRLAFVHGDYRTGNYLFDETNGAVTAVLDLELCHIGDHHADLAWAMQPTNGSEDGGVFYGSGVMEPEAFYTAYEQASGRRVDRRTLHFYKVFAVFKSMCIAAATAVRVAQAQHSHQDIVLTWMAGCGHVLHTQLCDLIDTEVSA